MGGAGFGDSHSKGATGKGMTFAIKAEVRDQSAKTFAFIAQKTMYGGKLSPKVTRFLCLPARMRVAMG